MMMTATSSRPLPIYQQIDVEQSINVCGRRACVHTGRQATAHRLMGAVVGRPACQQEAEFFIIGDTIDNHLGSAFSRRPIFFFLFPMLLALLLSRLIRKQSQRVLSA